MAKVQVSEGWLEGQILDLVSGDGKYYSFKGIPYAAPPIGKLRFKAPQPPQAWQGVRKAYDHGSICYQYDIFTSKYLRTTEDCLFLNVYSPNISPTKPLPVMVFIHGGGYKSGSGNSDYYAPDFLVSHEVILVTINYRLEVLGFLCLDTEDVPGNAGLKDQAAALRWVKNNINAFGGDPKNVTIFGESAGGASVTYHMVSPMSKGLFKRAIPMSGTLLCGWGVTFEPKRRAFALGKNLGINTQNSEELLEFLQSMPLEKLVNCSPKISVVENFYSPIDVSFFGPVVEKQFPGVVNFVNIHPKEILSQGLVNCEEVMIGYTSEEGILYKSFSKPYDVLNKYVDSFLPQEIALTTPVAKGLELAERIKQRYFSDTELSDEQFQQIAAYYSWICFKFNILRFLRLLPRNHKLYLYQFSAVTERNVNSQYFAKFAKSIKGVSHLDDLLYLFDQPIMNLPFNKQSKSWKIIQTTCGLWTNFAKYGDPTPDGSLGVKWNQYSITGEEYLDIDEELTPGKKLDNEEYLFWKELYVDANIIDRF